MKKLFLLMLILTPLSCTLADTGIYSTATAVSQEALMSIPFSSSAFTAGASIPAKYSCTGQSISPPLAWGDPPSDTKSFALIMDDPDAPFGTFVHWVIYNIPGSNRELAEAIQPNTQFTDGTIQGNNGAGRVGYTGPCPPQGTHRYFFKLYALNTVLSLATGVGKEQLVNAIQGHILAQGELMGTFGK